MTSTVSVIIPVRNRLSMLQRAVRSVLAQTFKKFELIVVDDGSTEDLSAVKEMVEEAGHRWIRQEQKGVSAARNRGVVESIGEWLAFLDSDDEWLPEKLERQLDFHRDRPGLQISQCEERWIRNGKQANKKAIHQMPEGNAFPQSVKLCCISPSSVMLSRSLFSEFGRFDESLPVCEDYDLWLKISAMHEVGLVREELVIKYGGHADQLSRSEPAIDRFRVFALLRLLEGGALSKEQIELVHEELQRKLTILRTGAEKHAPDMVPRYEELSGFLAGGELAKAMSRSEHLIE